MQVERFTPEIDAQRAVDAHEKVLTAYELADPGELLLRRPRTYRVAGYTGKGPPEDGMPVTLLGLLGQYDCETRDKLMLIGNTLDVEGLGRVFLSWIASAAKGKATQLALAAQCPSGTRVLVTGKAHYGRQGFLTIRQVEMEPASSELLAAIEAGKALPVPIYPLRARLRQAHVRSAIRSYLDAGWGRLPEALPRELERALGLPALGDALEVVHGLHTLDRAQAQALTEHRSPFQKRIDVERLWGLMRDLPQLAGPQRPAIAIRERCDDVIARLPFQLTAGQRAACDDVLGDLATPHATRRLLQGDVGCGKSIVALLALIACARAGAPAALLAPTDVLATQLHEGAAALAKDIGIRTFFVRGKLPAAKRRAIEAAARGGEGAIFIGTHALASIPFARLGVLVIDEEQRFGVALKERLSALDPHLITMSATPIPRSLATVMYAGHGVSSIRERPAGRSPVKTKIVDPPLSKSRLIEFMRETLRRKQQVFVLCPSIASEEIANVQEKARLLQSELGREAVRVLHGEMPTADIERTLADFHEAKFAVLVATPIIEVGIDVPRATLMVICDPERMGLAQLHQIRGRVGRGRDQAYCALLSGAQGAARERLEFFARTHDGFALAEKDLHGRGAGDLSGQMQSGFLEVDVLALADEALVIQRYLKAARATASPVPSDPVHDIESLRFEVAI